MTGARKTPLALNRGGSGAKVKIRRLDGDRAAPRCGNKLEVPTRRGNTRPGTANRLARVLLVIWNEPDRRHTKPYVPQFSHAVKPRAGLGGSYFEMLPKATDGTRSA